MSGDGSVVIVGGTRAIGREIARHYASNGRTVVLTGRDPAHVADAVKDVGGATSGRAFDLSQPFGIAAALAEVGPVDHLVLAAIDRDDNSVAEYDIARAIRLVTLKLVGYTEVVHTLLGRLTPRCPSVLLYGGMAKERPYPGSTTVTTINGGVVGLTRTLVEELRPRAGELDPSRASSATARTGWTSGGRPRADDRRDSRPAASLRWRTSSEPPVFLLENPAVNGVDLIVDGGWHCR